MSRFNSRKIALIGLKGEKGEPGDSGVLKGAGAPTTETIGEIGKFYVDTTSGTSYQCTSIVDGVYTWVKLIKETDYATSSKAGLLKASSNQGFYIGTGGDLSIIQAPNSDIDAKKNKYRPITSNNLDYAVKKALADSKLAGTTNAWTTEEQAKARETLGVYSLWEHTFELISKENDENGIVFATGSFYAITSDNLLKIDGQTLRISEENAKKITSPILIKDGNHYLMEIDYDNGGYKYGSGNNMLSDVLEVATGV